METYYDLPLWQKSIELVELIYRCTRGLPNNEPAGLPAQLRQTALTMVDHIATSSIDSTPQFLHSLTKMKLSLRYLEICLLLADRLNHASKADREKLTIRIDELRTVMDAFFHSLTASRCRSLLAPHDEMNTLREAPL